MKGLKLSLLRSPLIVVLAVAGLGVSNASLAGSEVALKLVDGKSFSDYQLTGDSRKKSLKRLEKDFVKLFENASDAYVAEGQKLEIDVTNIDLPGQMRYFYGPNNDDMRVVESNTPFRLHFTYRLKNSEGKLIKEGEAKIRDFSESKVKSANNRNFGSAASYHIAIKKWFKKQF